LAGVARETHAVAITAALPSPEAESSLRFGGKAEFGPFQITAFYDKQGDLSGVAGADRDILGLGGKFTFGNNAVKMVVSTATNALRMDIVDYELYRSGRFMPASVSATYSFVDKLVSSLGATIATGMVALIGYNQVAPQASDPLTTAVKVMTVVLLIGFPILGWICTILAMKKSELSREKMVEVQRTNKERLGQNVTEGFTEQVKEARYNEVLKEDVENK
jgi:hypothetical protein